MSGGYKLYDQYRFIDRMNKADQTWWTKDAVIACLVVGLSLLDGVTLYTVVDSVMFNSQLVSIILTAGCALSLNFLPLIMARFIHFHRYHINGVKVWMIAAMGVVFMILFSASFYLRWETRELSFSGTETSMIDTTGQAEGIDSTDANSNEAVAITILLGILPGVTSAINLALGYFNDDPVKRKLAAMKRDYDKLCNQRDIMLAARSELDQDWLTRLRELDHERLATAETMVCDVTEQVCALARLELAKKLGDADSVAMLTEPPVEESTEVKSPDVATDESKKEEGGLKCA